MEETAPERSVPFNLDLVFRRGVGRTLLFCFFGLALIPLVLIGWMGYRTVCNHLEQDLFKTLEATAQLKRRQLEAYLDVRLASAESQGRQPETIVFFDALIRRYQASEQTLDAFIQSTSWKTAVSAYGSGIRLHADLYGYSDILMIDPAGNVIFSNAGNNELAGNLYETDLAATGVVAAFRRTLETGKTAFGGFAPTPTANSAMPIFITAAIGNVGSKPTGVIIYQIPGSTIQQMLDTSLEPEKDARVYLIDTDLIFLAGKIDGREPTGHLKIDNAVTRQWRKHLKDGVPTPVQSTPLTYPGADGNQVTGTYAPIQREIMSYALIIEIDQAVAFAALYRLRATILIVTILTGAGVLLASVALAQMIVGPVRNLTQRVTMAVHGQLDMDIDVTPGNEIGRLAGACSDLTNQIKALKTEHETQSRFMAGLTSLNRLIGGEQEMGELCLNTLEFLADFLDLNQADFFIINDTGELKYTCHFPGQPVYELDKAYDPGEGRVGQAVLEKNIVTFRKDAANGLLIPVPSTDLANLVTVPLVLRDTVKGVLELEKATVFSIFEGRYLEAGAEIIAMALSAALIRDQEMKLLEQSREQANQLKVRKATLEASTRELEEQSRAFQASEQKLQLKQLELEAANAQMVKNAADLEANMAILENQKQDMQRQNAELERTHRQLAEKARQLETSSRYKTEFMANMSHELRTPLNSILLLSRLLLENKEKTLTARQSEFTQTIQSAGEDLLNLINEILDLARVESGKMGVELTMVSIQSIAKTMQKSFAPLAEQSGISFTIRISPDVPERLLTDRKRVDQIIKNFLSNAFKFTPRGSIRLEMAVSREPSAGRDTSSVNGDRCLAISVVDTGIGIPSVKHEMVFEAFQQVDGSTRRKYGGTGLGLSISQELARLLGGEITLESQAGKGSRFTLHLPLALHPDQASPIIRENSENTPFIDAAASETPDTEVDIQHEANPVPDDRHKLTPGDKCILIVEADTGTIAPIKVSAHQNGYKVLVAEHVQNGLYLADYALPAAIFANPHLSDANGWAFVHRIKANPQCRHIPVFSLSHQGDDFMAAVHGAAGHVSIPPSSGRLETVFRQIDDWRTTSNRNVLVVDPDAKGVTRIGEAISAKTIHLTAAPTATDAQAAVDGQRVHAVILHPELDTTEQHRFLGAMQLNPTPVLLYSGAPIAPHWMNSINQLTKTVNLKIIDTPDQLLSTLMAILHLSPSALDDAHRNRLLEMDNHRSALRGRKVLLADDDMRTVFAVTSALEDQAIEVCTGKTGKESLDKLDSFPDIDLILMDVMIADVDGYQAMRNIRSRDRYKNIPILVLTAKAMQGDRTKCIEAGADDYLAKPVNLDKLTSMLKIWLDPQLSPTLQ